VDDSACRHRGDYLGHVGQPGEGGGEPNPLQVNAECRFPRRIRGVRALLVTWPAARPWFARYRSSHRPAWARLEVAPRSAHRVRR
jgi:hypothetical protein